MVVAAIVVTIVLCCVYFSAWGKMSGNIYVSDQQARLLFGEDSLFLSEDFNEEYGLKPNKNDGGIYVEFDAYHYDRYDSEEPNQYDEKAYKYNGYYVSDAVKNGLSGVRLDYYKKGESDVIKNADKTSGELKYSEDINEGSVVLNVVKDKLSISMRGRLKTQCKSSRKRHCKTSSAARQADPSKNSNKRAKVGALVFAEEFAINAVKRSGTYFFKNFSCDELRLIFGRFPCQEVEYIFFQKMIGNAFRFIVTFKTRRLLRNVLSIVLSPREQRER